MAEVIRILESDAEVLCSRRESDLFDRKAAAIDGKKIEKIAVAFANADGGEFVIGIADDKDEAVPLKRWSGRKTSEEYNSALQCLFNLNPAVSFRYEFYECANLTGVILRVYIDRSQNVCKTWDGKVYQRLGAQSLPVTDPEKITALSFAKGAASYEDTLITNLKAEEIVDSVQIAQFCDDLTPQQEPLAYCVNEGLIDRAAFTPNCAGVLLFADKPQPIFPRRCGIKIIFYDTRQETPERDHLKKNITIEGALYKQIHDAVAAVTEIMSGINIMTTEGLKTVQYPAIR